MSQYRHPLPLISTCETGLKLQCRIATQTFAVKYRIQIPRLVIGWKLMTEEPLVVGAIVLIVGILGRLVASFVQDVANVWIGGWALLLVIIGILVIAVRLITMAQSSRSKGRV